MLDKKCVVMLYSKGVYDSSALAVAEKLENEYGKDIYVITVADEDVSPWKYATFSNNAYVFAERTMSFMNDMAYSSKRVFARSAINRTKKEFKQRKEPVTNTQKWMYNLKSKYSRVYNVLARYTPDVVLCATPDLLKKAVKAKYQQEMYNMSVCALITDYALDPLFVNYKADAYFVQNEDIKNSLSEWGIDDGAIYVAGTQLSEAVQEKFAREDALKELNITGDKVNIVVAGGRYGSDNIKAVYAKLVDGAEGYNLILLTGGSSSLNKYSAFVAKKGNTDNLYFIDEADSMAKIYAIADVMVCSPTAQLTYECLYHKVKLVLCKGSDGMQRRNAEYLIDNGLALGGVKTGQAIASITKFIEDEGLEKRFESNVESVIRGDWADLLARKLGRMADAHYTAKLDMEKKRQQLINNDIQLVNIAEGDKDNA